MGKDAWTSSRTHLVSIQNRDLSETLADVPKYDKQNALFQLSFTLLAVFNNDFIVIYSCYDKDVSLW